MSKNSYSVVWEDTEHGYTVEVDSDLCWKDALEVYRNELDYQPQSYTDGNTYDRLEIIRDDESEDELHLSMSHQF